MRTRAHAWRAQAEGEALHVRDAKERAIRRAAARRERSLLVNTESARLSFDTKRAAVKRLKRRQSFARMLNTGGPCIKYNQIHVFTC